MKFPSTKFLLQAGTAFAVIGFVATLSPSQYVFAQPAPPMGAQVQTVDPPERAGRLARITGVVSLHAEGAERWDSAIINYPVTNGYSFWAEPRAQADIEIAASHLVMDGATELDISGISERSVATTLAQGQLYLRLRGLAPDETYTVQTPRGVVTLRTDGRYLITAGDINTPSRAIVLQGRAQVGGQDFQLDLVANQAAIIEGTSRFTVRMTAIPSDRFLQAQLEREQPPQREVVAPPPLVRAMPGGEELSAYGSWQVSSQHGQVWYPRVDADWQPFRDGRWAWVQPWGWTWVDNAPWGFAPSHYGRWVRVGGRWAWSPGVREAHGGRERPVYAPAVVSFLNVGTAVGVGGLRAAPSVAWVPLGYNESYRPWYPVSDRYVRTVNVTTVTNVNNVQIINNTVSNVTINNFANRSAAVAAPSAVLVTSADVAQVARQVDPREIQQARVAVGQTPVAPIATTPGVTPLVARRLNLEPARYDGAPASAASGTGPRLDRPRGEQPGHPPLAGPATAVEPPTAARPAGSPAPAPTPGSPPAAPPAVASPPSVSGPGPAGPVPTGAAGQAPLTTPAPGLGGPGGPVGQPSTNAQPPAAERSPVRPGIDGQDRRVGQPPAVVPSPVISPPGPAPTGAAAPSQMPGSSPGVSGQTRSGGPTGQPPVPGATSMPAAPGNPSGVGPAITRPPVIAPGSPSSGPQSTTGSSPPGQVPTGAAAPSPMPGSSPGLSSGQNRSGVPTGQPPVPGAGSMPAGPDSPSGAQPVMTRPPVIAPGSPSSAPPSTTRPSPTGQAPAGAAGSTTPAIPAPGLGSPSGPASRTPTNVEPSATEQRPGRSGPGGRGAGGGEQRLPDREPAVRAPDMRPLQTSPGTAPATPGAVRPLAPTGPAPSSPTGSRPGEPNLQPAPIGRGNENRPIGGQDAGTAPPPVSNSVPPSRDRDHPALPATRDSLDQSTGRHNRSGAPTSSPGSSRGRPGVEGESGSSSATTPGPGSQDPGRTNSVGQPR